MKFKIKLNTQINLQKRTIRTTKIPSKLRASNINLHHLSIINSNNIITTKVVVAVICATIIYNIIIITILHHQIVFQIAKNIKIIINNNVITTINRLNHRHTIILKSRNIKLNLSLQIIIAANIHQARRTAKINFKRNQRNRRLRKLQKKN